VSVESCNEAPMKDHIVFKSPLAKEPNLTIKIVLPRKNFPVMQPHLSIIDQSGLRTEISENLAYLQQWDGRLSCLAGLVTELMSTLDDGKSNISKMCD
jgi:hypothetical protein